MPANGGGTLLLEEVIQQSGELSVFNETSVNTCRIATFMTRKGVLVPWGFMRTGRKGQYVDNAHQGGIFTSVDTKNGRLTGQSMDMFANTFIAHPESGVIFDGYRLPEWDSALELVRRAAKEVPEVQYSSWDLAHTHDKGWVIVEVNPSGQFLWQASEQKGCKEEIREIMYHMDLIAPYHLK